MATSKSQVGPKALNRATQDFGCYITIVNHTEHDFLLDRDGIVDGWGEWPLTQPVNNIKAGAAKTVQLDNKFDLSGSAGWVEYEVDTNEKLERFRVDFDCPYAFWKKNRVEATCSTGGLSIKKGWYPTNGHPLQCTVTIGLVESEDPKTSSAPETSTSPALSMTREESPVKAKYEFGFRAPAGIYESSPMHECIAIAAFILSKKRMAKATVPNNISPEEWEYFRGILWPDDPNCLLFNDRLDDNRAYGIGLEWLKEFKMGASWTMTRRSHFGDLQGLHSMASTVGEQPEVTRERILHWMGVMYRLAVGEGDISEDDSVTKHFPPSVFGPTWASTSLRSLLLATTPSYQDVDICRRALGVCLHLIQDSYAIGHVQRQLRNPKDKLGRGPDGFIHFRPGTHGDWGDIQCFHTYLGQNEFRHKHYDGVPKDYGVPSPRDLSTFDPVIGARSAIAGCLTLINLFADDTPWEKVRDILTTGIYKLHPDARPSDTDVDTRDLPSELSYAESCAMEKGLGANSGDAPIIRDRKILEVEEHGTVVSWGTPSPSYGRSTGRIASNRTAIILAVMLTLGFGFGAIITRSLNWVGQRYITAYSQVHGSIAY
ncbi:unnamed protein product [Clonostachys byssicola]|uniref:Uncharacterized protein n=1 Tax=Clonostachys byssicola TaxID=160290 RepID=A0A9N9UBC5_9HYPO|nr:unnamed protein product [Clonostachys byssicola]